MRILIAHNRYRVAGGEERHVRLLADGLERAGHEVRLLFRDSSRLESSRAARARAALFMAYDPAAHRAIRRLLRSWPADVVHFHNIHPLLTAGALHGARRGGAAVVLTLHNHRFACPAGTLTRNGQVHETCITRSPLACGLRNSRGVFAESLAYGLALEVQRRLRLLDRWVDAFVVPSRYLRDIAIRAGLPAAKLHLIRNAVELPALRPWVGEYSLFAGRLSPEKGLHTLVEAARLSRVPLRIAGGGPAEPGRGATGIRYLGELTPAELADVRERAAFLVVPSECPEVAPLSVLEAAAAGRGAIVTGLGGLPELVEDGSTGIVVPAGDARRLATVMERLWADPGRARIMGENARRLAADRFTVDRQIAELTAVYRSVIR